MYKYAILNDGKVLQINVRAETQALRIENGKAIAAKNPLDRRLSAQKIRWTEEAATREILNHPITSENINYRIWFNRQRKLKPWLDNIDRNTSHCLRMTDFRAWKQIGFRSLRNYYEYRLNELNEERQRLENNIIKSITEKKSSCASNQNYNGLHIIRRYCKVEELNDVLCKKLCNKMYEYLKTGLYQLVILQMDSSDGCIVIVDQQNFSKVLTARINNNMITYELKPGDLLINREIDEILEEKGYPKLDLNSKMSDEWKKKQIKTFLDKIKQHIK